MRKKIVAGNWKMNTTVAEGKSLAQEIVAALGSVPSDVQLILHPSLPFGQSQKLLKDSHSTRGTKLCRPAKRSIYG